jgi:hypothetical protein
VNEENEAKGKPQVTAEPSDTYEDADFIYDDDDDDGSYVSAEIAKQKSN